MPTPGLPDSADAVVVGGGTIGAWCAYFLRRAGLDRVVLLEKGMLGQGASSRAAGIVRMQGGTPVAVRLGQWSRRFYLAQREELGTDSGFVSQGYLLPCFTDAEVAAARDRMVMQSSLGVPVRWLDPAEVDAVNPPSRRAAPWAAPSAPTMATSLRRATSPRTRSPSPSAACGCASTCGLPAW
jgi:sarcosine oxidase subunit beta